jgi:hypothetical protein
VQNLPFILTALACPLGTGALTSFMMQSGSKQQRPQPGGTQQEQKTAQLRERGRATPRGPRAFQCGAGSRVRHAVTGTAETG